LSTLERYSLSGQESTRRGWGQLMKRSLLGSTGLCAVFASGAFGGGLASAEAAPAPYIAPPIFTWSGFYVGANLGGLWSRDSVASDFAEGGMDALSTSGIVGGVQAGYNYQISNFVVGAEGDLDWSSAKGSDGGLFGTTVTHSANLPFYGDLRARAGIAFDRFLPYVTGGVVFADLHNNSGSGEFTPPIALGRSEATGWTIGGGGEYAIDNHWSVKAEYLFMQFPGETQSYVNGAAYTFKFKDSAQVARAGLNYRF